MAIGKTFHVSLDMKAPTAQRDEWEVVEGDNGNVIEITLTDGGEAVDLTGTHVFAVFGLPNGATVEQDSVSEDGGVTISDTPPYNVITIALHTGSFSPGKSASGLMKCEIQVYSGTNFETLVTSAQFTFRCRRAIMNDDTIAATDAYPILVELISQVSGLIRENQSDWEQTDETQVDYIRNKPDLTEKLDTSVLALEYDSTATYSQYQYVMHDGQLYYSNTDIIEPEQWNADHWTRERMTFKAHTYRYGITMLSNTVDNNDDVAATPKAVNSVKAIAAAAIPKTEKGVAEGVAELDDNVGLPKVKAEQASARIKSISVAAYTLQLADAGMFLDVTNGANVTITIPLQSSVAWPAGTEIEICRDTTYTVTIAGASGVTIRSAGSKTAIADQYGCAVLKRMAENVWLLAGDLG